MKFRRLKSIYMAVFFLAIVLNGIPFLKYIHAFKRLREKRPYFFIGDKFSGLGRLFRGVKYVGYYTDKNLDVNRHAAQFAQAQYALAPTILDLNNTNHELIIFDCTSELMAWARIKEIQAVPIKRNNLGIIVARRAR